MHGIATAEVPDLDREICDYLKTKPFYKALAEKFMKATAATGVEMSMFPLREMHGLTAAGCGKSIEFNDEEKTITVTGHVVDAGSADKVRKGVLIGFSQGGGYVGEKTQDPVYKDCMRYVAEVQEISLVDSPCLPIALIDQVNQKSFAYHKADGSMELRKFHIEQKPEERLGRQIDRLASVLEQAVEKTAAPAAAATAPAAAIIPAGKAKMTHAQMLRAAKHNGIDAARLVALDKYMKASPLEKSMYDVKDLADVLSTLSFVQGCLAGEREWEGDDSTTPDDLVPIMESLQTVLLELLEEESTELIENARARIGGEKAMKFLKFDSLEKANAALEAILTKSENIKAALGKMKKMVSDHHDASVDMHKTQHSDIHASADHAAAKSLATTHLGKALGNASDHMTKMCGHLDKTIESMTEGDEGGSKLGDSGIPGEGSAHTTKTLNGEGTLTLADVEALMEKNSEGILDVVADLIKSTFADDGADGNGQGIGKIGAGAAASAAPAAGIGDRTNLDKSKGVHQNGRTLTKDEDINGKKIEGDEGVPTSDDVRKADRGDQAAMLKLARFAQKSQGRPSAAMLSRVR